MIVYLSDLKNSTRELLKLINNFSKMDGYKLIQTNQYPSYTQKDKEVEKEIREITPFTIARNNIK